MNFGKCAQPALFFWIFFSPSAPSQRHGGEQAAELVVFVGRAHCGSTNPPPPQYSQRLRDHVNLLRREPATYSLNHPANKPRTYVTAVTSTFVIRKEREREIHAGTRTPYDGHTRRDESKDRKRKRMKRREPLAAGVAHNTTQHSITAQCSGRNTR